MDRVKGRWARFRSATRWGTGTSSSVTRTQRKVRRTASIVAGPRLAYRAAMLIRVWMTDQPRSFPYGTRNPRRPSPPIGCQLSGGISDGLSYSMSLMARPRDWVMPTRRGPRSSEISPITYWESRDGQSSGGGIMCVWCEIGGVARLVGLSGGSLRALAGRLGRNGRFGCWLAGGPVGAIPRLAGVTGVRARVGCLWPPRSGRVDGGSSGLYGPRRRSLAVADGERSRRGEVRGLGVGQRSGSAACCPTR